MSKTLSRVTQSKIGDYLFVGERAKRDTIRDGQLKIGYVLYIIYIYTSGVLENISSEPALGYIKLTALLHNLF